MNRVLSVSYLRLTHLTKTLREVSAPTYKQPPIFFRGDIGEWRQKGGPVSSFFFFFFPQVSLVSFVNEKPFNYKERPQTLTPKVTTRGFMSRKGNPWVLCSSRGKNCKSSIFPTPFPLFPGSSSETLRPRSVYSLPDVSGYQIVRVSPDDTKKRVFNGVYLE